MATLAQKAIVPIRRTDGRNISILYFPEAASQSFLRGETVYLSSGQVTEFEDGTDDDSQRFLGFAAQDATGTENTRIGIWVADDQTIFLGSLYHSSGASSALTERSDVGTLYPMSISATDSKVYVDKEDTGSKIDCCRVVGLWADESHEEAVGDYYGRVLFIVEAAGRQLRQ